MNEQHCECHCERDKIEQMLKDAKSGKTHLSGFELNALQAYIDSLKNFNRT